MGTSRFPDTGDPSFSATSASLGDTIAPGSTRWYQTYFRDPDPIFCPSATFNVTNGRQITW